MISTVLPFMELVLFVAKLETAHTRSRCVGAPAISAAWRIQLLIPARYLSARLMVKPIQELYKQ